MKTANLYNKLISTIQQKSFYYQRFDACLNFVHFIPLTELMKDTRKPCTDTLRILFFENDTLDYYFLLSDLKKMTEKILDLSKKDPIICQTLMDKWDEDENIFYEKCNELKNLNLAKLKDDELMNHYTDYKRKYIKRVSSSSIIDGFVLYYDNQIAEKINKELESKNVQEKELVFSKLIATTFESFVTASEIFLLQIAILIKNSDKLLEEFKNCDIKKIKNLLKKNKNIEDQINEYINRFFWIRNNVFKDEKITKDEVLQELIEMLKQEIDFTERREILLKSPLHNKERKVELFNDLDISKQLQTILKISDDFALWQDMRKKSMLISTYYFSKIFEEIANRTIFHKDDLKYMFPSEIENIFKMSESELKKLKDEAKKRRIKSAVIYYKDGLEVITDPTEVDKLKLAVIDEEDFSGVKQLRGISASPGKVVGKVCILKSVKEMEKLKPGQILVAVMTRPDYFPVMKKCSAIITDEGGITSHAAVVARELNIPCIVGTRIATKVLQDGDVVEIDGDNGGVIVK